MSIRRGDIILTYVRFTSGPGGNIRPALVVQSDRNNQRLQDCIFALITPTTQRVQIEPTQLFIDIITSEGRAPGLLHNSAVKREQRETVLQADVQRTIGHLSSTLMQKIDGCLKAALGLP